MNFVRFVKTPRVVQAGTTKKSNVKSTTKKPSGRTLSMILTITTDFSPFAGSACLFCSLVSDDDKVLANNTAEWTPGCRDIPLEFAINPNIKSGKVVVGHVTSDIQTSNHALKDFLDGDGTYIVGLASSSFAMDLGSKSNDTVYRHFMLSCGPLTIAEQAGETIVRHVWDAGILLSSTLCCSSLSILPNNLVQLVSQTIATRTKNVLELGTGVGIVGVSIAAQFPHINVVATDLPEAQSLVEENTRINISAHSHLKRNISFRPLDWEHRPFPPWTGNEKFDLIAMADVTYNTATFMALADTLEHLLRTGSRGARIVCCSKRRHDEEEAFWRIILNRGFAIHERIVFAMDLDGSFRFSGDGAKEDGEQLIDFVSMSLS